MKKIYFCIINIVIILSSSIFVSAVDITIDTSKGRTKISQYIYGTNQPIEGGENFTAWRLGGNRMTGYNWENNASNAGNDWQHSSDNYMIDSLAISTNQSNEPARTITYFHEKSLSMNAYSLVTLQMAGYVAKDKNGTVTEQETAPSPRWAQVVFSKGKPFSMNPDTEDNFVYMDEEVNYLVNKFGNASTPKGIKGYALDNEPDIWMGTHPRIHPKKQTCEEIISKSVALAKAVKNVDPYAEIFGPASYGFNGFKTFQDAPDWYSKYQDKYDWFLSYYLDMMRKESKKADKRLLDVLDVHWYPEAQGEGKRIVTNGVFPGINAAARVQAPRSLWDPTYTETSWICQTGGCPIQLIPHLQKSIKKYYPGTKIGITEYDYGGGEHISGGIAMADVLGIFGKYSIYFATYWNSESGTYTSAAFKLYRNYDGNYGTFGDTKVKSETDDVADMPVYASINGKDDSSLHVIVINRDMSNTQTAHFTITSPQEYKSGVAWGFDRIDAKIKIKANIAEIKKNSFSLEIPPLSAYHIILNSK